MRYFPLLLLCFALSAPTLAAKTIPVRGQGFSITIPDDWTVVKRPNVVLVAAAPGQTTALGILCLHQRRPTPGRHAPTTFAGWPRAC